MQQARQETTMPDPIEQLADGIYFGLPIEVYRGQERLSSSGCSDMLISPADFWANSWMNPDREDESSEAQVMGTAYHMARLEPDRFKATYLSTVNPADYPNVLTTGDQIKAELKELGLPMTKAGEKTLDTALRLKAAGYPGPIMHILNAELEERAEAEGKIILPYEGYRQIAVDMARLHENVEIGPFLSDGQPEVSVFWTDGNGIKWKVRIDYLKARHVVDVKTFINSMGKNLDKCIADIIAFNRYYIQGALYWRAAEEIRKGELAIRKVQNQSQKDLIAEIRASEDIFEYWWVFQQKGGVPNVLARWFRQASEPSMHYLVQAPDEKGRELLRKKIRKPTRLWEKGQLELDACALQFRRCLEAYGTAPWGPNIPVSDIDDEAFSPYFLES
jgi:hypothetical protein